MSHHEIHRVTSVHHVADFTLRLGFDDGTQQTIDFSPVLAGEIYGPLADPHFFRQVHLDPEGHTITWPNGADFDPAQLHDWPHFQEQFAKLTQSWSGAPV